MKIRLFKDEPPLCFNLEKWGINNIPILLVTGLSGSGKNAFAKKYALQHKAVCISFDVFKILSAILNRKPANIKPFFETISRYSTIY